MIRRHWIPCAGLVILAGVVWVAAPVARSSQKGDTRFAPSNTVIKTESNLVLVDAVVTDKKGKYITSLTRDDFKVYEDGKEQPLAAFTSSSGTPEAAGAHSPHYIVLFFDNSTMDVGDQARARKAAAQFVEKTASTNRLMAVVDFGGTTKIAQNFTDNRDLLAQAVSGVKFSSVGAASVPASPDIAALGAPMLASAVNEFAARTILLSLRNLCDTLRTVKGRKTLILFSGGFPLDAEREAELTATIDAANKANVAIYPMDVRGLVYLSPSAAPGTTAPNGLRPFPPSSDNMDPFPHASGLVAALFALPFPAPQRPGGGGPRGGGGGPRGGGGGPIGPVGGGPRGGGGPMPGPSGGGGGAPGGGGGGRGGGGSPGGGTRGGGTRGGGGGGGPNNTGNYYGRYSNQPLSPIIPQFPASATTNQEVLYALAKGTGGFTIFNTNGFLSGLTKISDELDDYYTLGYVPPHPKHNGEYHSIGVKVKGHGLEVRARNGYYDVKSPDELAGKSEGAVLEAHAEGSDKGTIPVSLSEPYFYVSPGVARVNVSLEIPSNTLRLEKQKGKFDYSIDVLGIAYTKTGSVAARFSDRTQGSLDKKEKKELSKTPFKYQTSFKMPPGQYRLVLVLSAGGTAFGKYEAPLDILPFDGHHFELSAIALSDDIQPVTELIASLDQSLLEERTPLTSRGYEYAVSADRRFASKDKVALYVEVYEPLLTGAYPPRVGVLYNIFNRTTNSLVYASDTVLVNDLVQPGSPLIPVGMELPVGKLSAGSYRLEVVGRDDAGNVTPKQAVDFTVQ